jgi:phosphate transport system permease protein
MPVSTTLKRLLGLQGTDVGGSALAASGIGAASLLATLLALLFAPTYAVFPLLGLVATAAYGWAFHRALAARGITFAATLSTLIILGLIVAFLFRRSLGAFLHYGPDLFLRHEGALWSPGSNRVSLFPAIYGTAMLTVVAVAVAAPLGVAGALFVNEIAPGPIREVVKPAVEVLAGIPSIVYGYVGFVTLNNFMRDAMLDAVKGSFLLAGLVVGVMALPTVVTVAEDALDSVPDAMKDGSLALGATDWQTMKSISLPASVSGVSAAVLLGIGRAVGETMAATAILGGQVALPVPFFDAFDEGQTLTTLVANFYGNASESTMDVLFAAGVVLFVIVGLLSLASQIVERRMQRTLRGER